MRRVSAGFTLLELMVVVAIIGILSAIIISNIQGANARGRDAERQSELRQLQIAIEAYKRVHGRYPAMGCGLTLATAANGSNNGDGFASESECADYIVGLAPQFIERLPKDPRRDTNEQGYSYTTNGVASGSGEGNGTVYKVMAMRTVESESVTYSHSMKSCDINPLLPSGAYPSSENGQDFSDNNGWCARTRYTDPRTTLNTTIRQADCIRGGITIGAGAQAVTGNLRFDTSYGLWGGIATPDMNQAQDQNKYAQTTQVICE